LYIFYSTNIWPLDLACEFSRTLKLIVILIEKRIYEGLRFSQRWRFKFSWILTPRSDVVSCHDLELIHCGSYGNIPVSSSPVFRVCI